MDALDLMSKLWIMFVYLLSIVTLLTIIYFIFRNILHREFSYNPRSTIILSIAACDFVTPLVLFLGLTCWFISYIKIEDFYTLTVIPLIVSIFSCFFLISLGLETVHHQSISSKSKIWRIIYSDVAFCIPWIIWLTIFLFMYLLFPLVVLVALLPFCSAVITVFIVMRKQKDVNKQTVHRSIYVLALPPQQAAPFTPNGSDKFTDATEIEPQNLLQSELKILNFSQEPVVIPSVTEQLSSVGPVYSDGTELSSYNKDAERVVFISSIYILEFALKLLCLVYFAGNFQNHLFENELLPIAVFISVYLSLVRALITSVVLCEFFLEDHQLDPGTVLKRHLFQFLNLKS